MSVDPLAEKYAYNGVYNFSENRVIDARELEGLEAILAITLGHEVEYRGEILKKANSKVIHKNLQSFGVYGFMDAFETASSSDPNGIGFVAIWGHGIPGMIWGDSTGNTEINTSELSILSSAISNGDIKFAKNAIIYLGNCNTGTINDGDVRSFAAELSKITGATVIGGKGSVGLKPGSQVENATSMIYWMYYPKKDSFLSFENGIQVQDLGASIDVVNLMKFAMKKTNPITPVVNDEAINPIPIPNMPRGLFGHVYKGKFIDTGDFKTY